MKPAVEEWTFGLTPLDLSRCTRRKKKKEPPSHQRIARKEDKVKRIKAWLDKPVKGLWLERGTLIHLLIILLFLVSMVTSLVGPTWLRNIAWIAGGAGLTIMITFGLVETLIKEINRNRPSGENQTEP